MATPFSPDVMNSLTEWLISLNEEPDLTSMFTRSMPNVTPSTPRLEKVMPLKGRLLSRTGTLAPSAPELSYSQESEPSTAKNQTLKTLDGELRSNIQKQFSKKLESSLTIIDDPVDGTTPWMSGKRIHNLFIQWSRQSKGEPMPAHWYTEEADQMLVFMGMEPRPGAKYEVPND